MRGIKNSVIAALIGTALAVTTAVSGAMAASVSETADEPEISGTMTTDEVAAPQEEGEIERPEEEETGRPEKGESDPQEEGGTEPQEGSPENENTAAEGSTLDHEKAAEVEPDREPEVSAEPAQTLQTTDPQDSPEEVPEPDWLAGGTGTAEDLTDSNTVYFVNRYVQRYENYGLGYSTNCTFDVLFNGSESLECFVCLNPEKSGYGITDKYADHVYEYTTPMLAKAFYYGVGPGSSVLEDIVEEVMGSRDGMDEITLIVTHIAASQVYSKLNEADSSMGSSKSAYNDGFLKASPELKLMVNKFGNAIEGMYVPKSYHVYVAAIDNGRLQDSGYGFFNKGIPEEAQLKLKKGSQYTEIVTENGCYSLKGAEFGVYTDEACTDEAGTLTTDENGESPELTLASGKTYYVQEKKAPAGYRLSDEIYPVTLERSDETYTVDVTDEPVFLNTAIRIEKKSVDGEETGASLEGTEFTIKYYDGFYSEDDLPEQVTREWVIKALDTEEGCIAELKDENLLSGELYQRDGETVLPLGTVTISETKAAEGYINDGEFGEGADTYIGRIRQNDETGEAGLESVQGQTGSENSTAITFTVYDTPEPPEPPEPEPSEPEIETEATDGKDGDKTLSASGRLTVNDNVIFRNLKPGCRYRFKGVLMEKASGKAIVSGGRIIEGETLLDAETSDGNAIVSLTFDAADLKKGDYVVFEEVYEIDAETSEEQLAAEHKDLEDDAQTVFYPGKPTVPGTPPSSPGTGDPSDLVTLMASIAICSAGVLAAALWKKREQK